MTLKMTSIKLTNSEQSPNVIKCDVECLSVQKRSLAYIKVGQASKVLVLCVQGDNFTVREEATFTVVLSGPMIHAAASWLMIVCGCFVYPHRAKRLQWNISHIDLPA